MPLPIIAAAVGTAGRVATQAAVTGVRVVARGTVATARGAVQGATSTARGVAQGTSRVTEKTARVGNSLAQKSGRFVARKVVNSLDDRLTGAYDEKKAIRNELQGASLLRPTKMPGQMFRSAPVPGFIKRAGFALMPGDSKKVARRMGITPPVSRSPARKAFGAGKATYRISKGTGHAMVAFAFFLDILPILLAVVMLFAAFQGPIPPDSETPWWNVVAKAKEAAEAWGAKAGGAFKIVLGVLVLAPATYFLASLLVPVLAFLFFLFWFLSKRVNPFSIPGALLLALETIPFVNILPTITLVVWRRVRASRKEDELRYMLSSS